MANATDPQAPQAARLPDSEIAKCVRGSPAYPVTTWDRAIADAACDLAYRVGVAETEAKYAEGCDNWYRKGLADERANGAALAAAGTLLYQALAGNSETSTYKQERRDAWDAWVKALATHNASQGPEESHES